MARIALKVAYDGIGFRGSQQQPKLRTVEGELIRTLKKLKLIESFKKARFEAAGRTDVGVHAIGQVFAFNTDQPQKVIVGYLNSNLPEDIRVIAIAKVSDEFSPRHDAIKRHYRYLYPVAEKLDLKAIKKAAVLLKGTHDFRNFSIFKQNQTYLRRLYEVSVKKQHDFLIFDIIGESFLRMMVRKIVTALLKVRKKEFSPSEFERLLDPNYKPKVGLEPAPPYGLVLMDVKYPFKFQVDKKLTKKMIGHWKVKADLLKTLWAVEAQKIKSCKSLE